MIRRSLIVDARVLPEHLRGGYVAYHAYDSSSANVSPPIAGKRHLRHVALEAPTVGRLLELHATLANGQVHGQVHPPTLSAAAEKALEGELKRAKAKPGDLHELRANGTVVRAPYSCGTWTGEADVEVREVPAGHPAAGEGSLGVHLATSPVLAGRPLGMFRGAVVTEAESDRSGMTMHDVGIRLHKRSSLTLLSSPFDGWAALVNDPAGGPADANCAFKVLVGRRSDDGRLNMQVWLVAVRDIAVGDELTLSYGANYWKAVEGTGAARARAVARHRRAAEKALAVVRSAFPVSAASSAEYRIERFLAVATVDRGGGKRYLVKWRGYAAPSWEPEWSLRRTLSAEDIAEMLATVPRPSGRGRRAATPPLPPPTPRRCDTRNLRSRVQ